MKKQYDVIIIGAGAAGLMAMNDLLEAGNEVCLLEAAPYAGGRIATIQDQAGAILELGAEFIHGKLPLTLKLLKKAGINYQPVKGRMISVLGGEWNKQEAHEEHWDELIKNLRHQKTDTTISEFLDQYFNAPEYAALRRSVQNFAQGFDLADITDASVLAVQKEWEQEGETQYRIPGGYSQLIDYLQANCLALEGEIYFNSTVTSIRHSINSVSVVTTGKTYEAKKVIVTVSAGALKADAISFVPRLGSHQQAIRQLGFGAVIKILLKFRSPFWQDREKEIGFLITDEKIPTWWTHYPSDDHILTGWVGGPPASQLSKKSNESILNTAVESLAAIFQMPLLQVKSQLLNHNIICWKLEPFTKGGYSYHTLYSEKAIAILSEPVNETVYFAGEAIYTGDAQGTVEAALQSGKKTADKILNKR